MRNYHKFGQDENFQQQNIHTLQYLYVCVVIIYMYLEFFIVRLDKRFQGFHVALSDVGSIGKLLYYFYNLQLEEKLDSKLLCEMMHMRNRNSLMLLAKTVNMRRKYQKLCTLVLLVPSCGLDHTCPRHITY